MCPCNTTYQVQRASTSPRSPAVDGRPATPLGSMRVSDAEREAAAGELRAHAATGRLDVDELDARLGAVLGARTHAQVESALSDLPATGATMVPVKRPPRRAEGGIRAYALVMLLLLTIWLLTGAGHFWPLYPALGWGLPLMLGRSCGPRRRLTTGP